MNSAAIDNPYLISEAADKFGSQCVVLAIDAKRREDGSGWNIYKHGGRIDCGIDAVEWAMKAAGLGAGAFGASINMKTQGISPTPYAEFSGSYGSFNTHKETVKVGTGLINGRWGFDARLSNIHSDGYRDRASADLKEKKDRVDDALCATRAAIEEGIVPGGGVTYIRAIDALEGLKGDNADETTGIEIIKRAIEEPLRQIVANAGKEGAVVVQKVREGKGDFGYNARTDVYEHLHAAGVVDPAKVTRVALENAASIAGMFLTTECVIVEKKEEKPEMPMAAPGMGGMGGMM